MTGYPVQIAKVQAPPLRDDTLARPRLLDWLSAKIHHRLVLLIAEAGYGKTTLLADFARRTRVRAIWYRLDDTDRGWAPFIAHLVAAAREHDPGFAPATSQLLRELGPAGPSRDTVLNTYLRELLGFCSTGVALIIDDFHLVDDAEEVTDVVRDLISRAPERFTIVIASRRKPALPMARLRSLGEVAELTVQDLRFDRSETASLFRDAYHHPLDADTIAELTARTEGWAASLQLVQAAIRDRTPRETRAFIRSLSGAEGDLYDYLAEEVVGHLSPEMQRFLMRTSLLETVEPDLAAVAADVDVAKARSLIASAERFGLLSRRGTTRGTFRFHPLVREFLVARIIREEDPDSIRELNRAIAKAAEASAWNVACSHYASAGDVHEIRRVLDASVGRIMASGQYALAARFVRGFELAEVAPGSSVILSRLALARDDHEGAADLARRAVGLSSIDDNVVGNLISVLVSTGEYEEARTLARGLAERAQDVQIRGIAGLTIALVEASVDGHLPTVVRAARDLAQRSADLGSHRYEGIALLNAAEVLRAVGRADEALRAATAAQHALQSGDSPMELPTAVSIRAWALGLSGQLAAARTEFQEARGSATGSSLVEALAEFAAVEALYGDADAAAVLLAEAETKAARASRELAEKIALVKVHIGLRKGDLKGSARILSQIRARALSAVPARETWRLSLKAHLAAATGDPDTREVLDAALASARAQETDVWTAYCLAIEAAVSPAQEVSQRILAVAERFSSALSALAELIAARLGDLDEPTLEALRPEMSLRPERWRPVLRAVASTRGECAQLIAARSLDVIGSASDVALLRQVARSTRTVGTDRALGKGLARRLARRVFIEDQGRVVILVGGEAVPNRSIRRKVLSLLCFLLTKPEFTAPRDEVLEALWPEIDPGDALNSLNQTAYFLRRVFEPEYAEDLSPEYLHHDSELIWLDQELVSSRSARCGALLATMNRTPTPDQVAELCATYQGRFALDFAYEDWAAAHRDTQHAAYLHVIEESVRLDTATGHFRRGIDTARRALVVDPQAHDIERALLRLYRLEGAHAAAGEQYGHYSAVLRADLDVDPPPLDSI